MRTAGEALQLVLYLIPNHSLSRYANLNVENYYEVQCLASNKYNISIILIMGDKRFSYSSKHLLCSLTLRADIHLKIYNLSTVPRLCPCHSL